jgi:hypothetical protein
LNVGFAFRTGTILFEQEMTLAADQSARIVPPPKGEELQMLGETISAQVEHAGSHHQE